MTLISRTFRLLNLLRAQQSLLEAQDRMIRQLRDDNARVRLDYTRQLLGVVSSWRIHMESPEVDLRDDVTALADELANQTATLEEYVL